MNGICASPRDSCVENLIPGDSTSKWALGKWLGCEGRALINGIRVLIMEARKSTLAPFSRGDTAGRCRLWTRKRALVRHQICWSWTSRPRELWEVGVCCLYATQSTIFCCRDLDGLKYRQMVHRASRSKTRGEKGGKRKNWQILYVGLCFRETWIFFFLCFLGGKKKSSSHLWVYQGEICSLDPSFIFKYLITPTNKQKESTLTPFASHTPCKERRINAHSPGSVEEAKIPGRPCYCVTKDPKDFRRNLCSCSRIFF